MWPGIVAFLCFVVIPLAWVLRPMYETQVRRFGRRIRR